LSSLDTMGSTILELNLSNMGWLSTYALSFIGDLCGSLETINVCNCLRLNDACFQKILRHCTQLTSVTLNQVRGTVVGIGVFFWCIACVNT
jgi:hypothetical protein